MLTVSGVSARTTAAMLGRPTVWWWGVLWCTTVLVVLVVVVILRSTVVTLTSMALVLRGSRTAIAGWRVLVYLDQRRTMNLMAQRTLSSVTARTLLLAVAVLRLSTITSLCAVLAGLRVLLGSGATVLVIAVLVASMLVATVLAARTLVGALVL